IFRHDMTGTRDHRAAVIDLGTPGAEFAERERPIGGVADIDRTRDNECNDRKDDDKGLIHWASYMDLPLRVTRSRDTASATSITSRGQEPLVHPIKRD